MWRAGLVASVLALSSSFATAARAEPTTQPDPPPSPDQTAPPSLVRLAVPGQADGFYVEPKGTDEQPLLLVLHARNRDPEEDCKRWMEVAAPLGWLFCPSGPVGTDHNRSWGKIEDAKKAIDDSVDALRAKFGARVKPAGNVVVGFSEGALMAQVIGIREPERWSRWLILAGSDRYWGDAGPELLQAQRRKIARVVMLTGDSDPILENTLRAGHMVRDAHIPVRVIVQRNLGHEMPADRMVANYERSLHWLLGMP